MIPFAMLDAPVKGAWPPERMAKFGVSGVEFIILMAVDTSCAVVGETMQRGWRLEFCWEK